MNPLSRTPNRSALQAADKPTLQRAQSQPALSVTREPLTAANGEPQDLTGPTNLMSEPEPGEADATLTVLLPLTQTQAEPFVLERAAERLAPEPRSDCNVVQEVPTAPAPLPDLMAMKNGIRVQTDLALFFAEMQGVLSKAVTDHGLPANTFQGLDQLFTQARDTCRKLVERDSRELLGYAARLNDDAEQFGRLARQAQGGTALPSDGELAREISKIPDATQRDQVAAAAGRAQDIVGGRPTPGRSANAKELRARFLREELPGDAAPPPANTMGFSRKADSSPSNDVDYDPLAELVADLKGDPRYSGQFEDTEESEFGDQATHPVGPLKPQQSAQGDRSELQPPPITPAPVTAARSPIEEAQKELAAALTAKPFNPSSVEAARAKLAELENGETSNSDRAPEPDLFTTRDEQHFEELKAKLDADRREIAREEEKQEEMRRQHMLRAGANAHNQKKPASEKSPPGELGPGMRFTWAAAKALEEEEQKLKIADVMLDEQTRELNQRQAETEKLHANSMTKLNELYGRLQKPFGKK
ncbi:hypothetical protein [Hydrogenophaga sp. T2]|uniref:hypothetical protein n=1 Tax=Hydrogenophaga sp. T2 TaxID=3132823 RepID=UPI003CF7FC81